MDLEMEYFILTLILYSFL
jgi:hypothetical protein